MVKQIYFGIVLHNHQPVGNFPWVFEQAYEQAYLPMLEAIERHPDLSFSVHYSGPLLDWLKQNRAEFIRRLGALAAGGRIDIIGGGYYEPILPVIPDADKLGQIAKMNSCLKNEFGLNPTGMWLAERVWEPYLAKILALSRVQWTLVDDTHFGWLGLEPESLCGYYVTEEQGYPLKIFPISKHLRYSIPWHQVDKVIEFFGQQASDTQTKIFVLGDDGEKFGVWPGTYKHCWQEKWVDNFFTALEANGTWLHTVKLADYVKRFPPQGRAYLPCAAYDEILEWSLPAEKSWQLTHLKKKLEADGQVDLLPFVRAGFWRHFLVKYPEVNRMYCKMLRVHKKVYQARADRGKDVGMDELWQAQCNEPYWHGIFGGIYLSDLRATTYRNLIRAEVKAEKALRRNVPENEKISSSDFSWEKADFDGDGFKEIMVESPDTSLYLSPQEGGSIFEWDLKNYHYNLLSTLARRPEAYHKMLTDINSNQDKPDVKEVFSIHDGIMVKDSNLSHLLVYDLQPRSGALDHFFDSGVSFRNFTENHQQESGDFLVQPYQASLKNRTEGFQVCLRRKGSVLNGEERLPFEVTKIILLEPKGERVTVSYKLRNLSHSAIEGVFGSEWNLNLLGGGQNEAAYYKIPGLCLDDSHLDSRGELTDVSQIYLGNKGLGLEVEIKVDPPLNLWRYPVETISNSETGIEKLYQASCLIFLLPFELSPEEFTSFRIDWAASSLH